MKPVLIRQHNDTTPPGLLVEWLEERGIPYEVHHSYVGEGIPNPSDYAFVVSLGSPYSPRDTHEPSVVDEMELVQRAIDRDVPVLGLCFGGEVLSAVLGVGSRRRPRPSSVGGR